MGELFAGYGGLGMGLGRVLDVDLAWVAEHDPDTARTLPPHGAAARVLHDRQHRHPRRHNVTGTPAITPGTYWVDADCPTCGQAERIAAQIVAKLTVTDDDAPPTIRVALKSRPVDHACHQMRISITTEGLVDVDTSTGEIL
jgi:hypothetical protein